MDALFISTLLGIGVGFGLLGFLGKAIVRPIRAIVGILSGLLLIGLALAPLGFGGLLTFLQSWGAIYGFVVGFLGGSVAAGWLGW